MAIQVYLLASGEQEGPDKGLSEFGVRRAAGVGRIFAKRGVNFQHVRCGQAIHVVETLTRVMRTAKICLPVCTAEGLTAGGQMAAFSIKQSLLQVSSDGRVLVVVDASQAADICKILQQSWTQNFECCALAVLTFSGTYESVQEIVYDGIPV